ncbi:MAG: hypothetical protein VYE40_03235 [Myxococcota bacterium]|nr:hypothetical protein [Myxococcota bacterium]
MNGKQNNAGKREVEVLEQPHNKRFEQPRAVETPHERGERHKKTFIGALIAFLAANILISVGGVVLFFVLPCVFAAVMAFTVAPERRHNIDPEEAREQVRVEIENLPVQVSEPAIRIERVEVHMADGVLGIAPELEVDAIVLRDLDFVEPSYSTMVRCMLGERSKSGDAMAFHMTLNGAKAGAKVHDSIKPFHARSLPQEPSRCEITFQRQGEPDAVYFCYQHGKGTRLATQGRCPE